MGRAAGIKLARNEQRPATRSTSPAQKSETEAEEKKEAQIKFDEWKKAVDTRLDAIREWQIRRDAQEEFAERTLKALSEHSLRVEKAILKSRQAK